MDTESKTVPNCPYGRPLPAALKEEVRRLKAERVSDSAIARRLAIRWMSGRRILATG
jgi:hypothetical protein